MPWPLFCCCFAGAEASEVVGTRAEAAGAEAGGTEAGAEAAGAEAGGTEAGAEASEALGTGAEVEGWKLQSNGGAEVRLG